MPDHLSINNSIWKEIKAPFIDFPQGLEFPHLRIPDSYGAKIVEMCNHWTFWPVIQPISPLFKIGQKAFLPDAP